MKAVSVHVNGIVQGVGFRPFIYRLARRFGIRGWVLNSSRGVEISAEGQPANVDGFLVAIKNELPVQAAIDEFVVRDAERQGFKLFEIRESRAEEGVTRISPDIAVCGDCLRELGDPADRRYRYPFTNCTNCGPRLSIIRDTPYDRDLTTMAAFAMCPDCAREYADPADRRFHAQPNACPACGPQVSLLNGSGEVIAGREDAIEKTAELLMTGHIIAVKGIGGFHLACDAANAETVSRLRSGKQRPHKPLALMCDSLASAWSICEISGTEARLLSSPQAPIVLLEKSPLDQRMAGIAESAAPGNRFLGVMLPHAPLHHLLFEEMKKGGRIGYLVMTSANVQDQPIVAKNQVAVERLSGLADYFLVHDRGIENRNDDSIASEINSQRSNSKNQKYAVQIIRHSRGYAPNPVELPVPVGPTLAVGGEMKNCFCLASGTRAFLSQHIGQVDSQETLDFFTEMVAQYKRWFRIEPEVIVHDSHPDYLTTRWAREQPGVQLRAVQHHRAHVMSVLADHRILKPVIGVAYDGTGYGDDGTIWGGEFFMLNGKLDDVLHDVVRAGHLEYLPLPGGEAAIRKPYRIAAAYCQALMGDIPFGLFADIDPKELQIIQKQVEENVNVAHTSSLGRLFDAASALLGICSRITFEAQAAMALESRMQPGIGGQYGYRIENGVIRIAELWSELANDAANGADAGACSAKFHNTIVAFTADMCRQLRTAHGIGTVALSGGVFQNRRLLEMTMAALENDGFEVLINRQVPCNDGGISLGQVLAFAGS